MLSENRSNRFVGGKHGSGPRQRSVRILPRARYFHAVNQRLIEASAKSAGATAIIWEINHLLTRPENADFCRQLKTRFSNRELIDLINLCRRADWMKAVKKYSSGFVDPTQLSMIHVLFEAYALYLRELKVLGEKQFRKRLLLKPEELVFYLAFHIKSHKGN